MIYVRVNSFGASHYLKTDYNIVHLNPSSLNIRIVFNVEAKLGLE